MFGSLYQHDDPHTTHDAVQPSSIVCHIQEENRSEEHNLYGALPRLFTDLDYVMLDTSTAALITTGMTPPSSPPMATSSRLSSADEQQRLWDAVAYLNQAQDVFLIETGETIVMKKKKIVRQTRKVRTNSKAVPKTQNPSKVYCRDPER